MRRAGLCGALFCRAGFPMVSTGFTPHKTARSSAAEASERTSLCLRKQGHADLDFAPCQRAASVVVVFAPQRERRTAAAELVASRGMRISAGEEGRRSRCGDKAGRRRQPANREAAWTAPAQSPRRDRRRSAPPAAEHAPHAIRPLARANKATMPQLLRAGLTTVGAGA